MRVAVTGGSGQLGTVMLERLLDDRKVKSIVSIDVRPPWVTSAKLSAVRCDVRSLDIEKHLAGCDVLFHFAFLVKEHRARAEVDDVNINGSKNAFECAARTGVRQIVYSSSIAAYGVLPGHPEPVVEDTPRRFQESFAYSATKFRVEEFLDGFERTHPEIAIVRLRPAILFGARMDHSYGPALRRGIFLAAGKAPLPVVWDEDVVDAAWLAMKKGARGAFNVCADVPLPPAEFARAGGLRPIPISPGVGRALAGVANALAKRGLGRAVDPAWLENANVRMIVSSQRARDLLGWAPRCNTCAEVIERHRAQVPRATDRRIALFFRMVDRLARTAPIPPDNARVRMVVGLQLTGPGGGDFEVKIWDGRLSIRTHRPRSPDATLSLPTRYFLDALAGKTDIGAALVTGKVRSRGEPSAMMVLQGIATAFAMQRAKPGRPGAIPRALAKWFAR